MIDEIHQLRLVNLLLLAFCTGILLAQKISWLYWCIWATGIIFFIVTLSMLLKQQRCLVYGLVVLFGCIGFIRAMQVAVVPANDISNWLNKNIILTGTVAAEVQVTALERDIVRIKYLVDVQSVRDQATNYKASGKAQIYVQQKAGALIGEYGDKIIAKGELKGLHGYRNPGQIDSVATALRQGISARLNTGKQGVAIETSTNWYWQKWVNRARNSLLIAMQKVMPAEDASAIFAMLFGGYGGIRPELLEAFTATGIVHILSVSGSHIALLAGTLQQFGKTLRIHQSYLALIVSGAIIIYSGFAGFVPPVIRSAAMGILSFLALILGREKDACRLLALTALIMLAVEPRLLYDISFQLSFGATAGLLYLAEPLRRNISLPYPIAASFAVTIAAQAGVLPLLAWYFNSLSLSALIANFLVVPIIEFLLVVGLAGAIIGIALPLLQNILFVFCSLLLGLVYNITIMVSALPFSNIYLPTVNTFVGGGYYVGLYLLLQSSQVTWLKRKYIFSIISFCCVIYIFVNYLGANKLSVHFIDVGQGDAALIITPNKHAVLLDTGGVLRSKSNFDVGERVVLPYLRHYGVCKLDYLVLTHAHDDHAGGAAAVCKKITVDKILIGREDRELYARIFKTGLANLTSCIPAYTGQSWTVDGISFRVLYAAESVENRSGNETSSVIKISYGKHSFLITGDLDAKGEAALICSGIDLQSSVLKVAHHGSKTSSTADFLQEVQPIFAVISVGADNSFGHPALSVLNRLKYLPSKVLRTDQMGAIVFHTDGTELTVTTFMEDR